MIYKTYAIGLFICSMLVSVAYSQTTETDRLLEQAEEIVFSNPKESIGITDHLLKTTISNSDQIKALYLNALGLYVSGQYDLALEKAYASKNLSDRENLGEYSFKNSDIIQRIHDFLKLSNPFQGSNSSTFRPDSRFELIDLVKKVQFDLLNNQIHTAEIDLKKAESLLNLENPGYGEALFYGVKGELLFKQKEIESSVNAYSQALKINEKIENPFLNETFNQNLSADYLLMDSLSQFQLASQNSKDWNIKTAKIESSAANEAHTLKLKDYDQQTNQLKSRYDFVFRLILGMLVIGILLKIIFFVRNRNKLKMYQQLSAYLENQRLESQRKVEVAITESIKEKEIEIEVETVPEMAEVQEEESAQKTSKLLKESEEQLMIALEKFEQSKKFTHKDMSLGMLASQLNTNTKYLSEVINRVKGKNFNAYINELRINYITDKIRNNPNYLNYKVSYLAEECGYSSHSTFTTVFKSIVGVSPIMFVEFVKEEMKNEVETV